MPVGCIGQALDDELDSRLHPHLAIFLAVVFSAF